MLFNFLQSKGIFNSIKSGEVIDVGSGDGREGKAFEENGFSVTSIDIKNGIDATKFIYPEDRYEIAIAKFSPFYG